MCVCVCVCVCVSVHRAYPVVSLAASSGNGGGHDVDVSTGPDRRNSASIASLRLLAKEHQLQTLLDVKREPTTFLR